MDTGYKQIPGYQHICAYQVLYCTVLYIIVGNCRDTDPGVWSLPICRLDTMCFRNKTPFTAATVLTQEPHTDGPPVGKQAHQYIHPYRHGSRQNSTCTDDDLHCYGNHLKTKPMCMTKTNPSSGLVPDAAAATATQAPLDLYRHESHHLQCRNRSADA
jgi:hypothetical protein